MMRITWVVEALNLATSQNDLTDTVWAARPALEQVAQVKRAQLILIGSHNRVVAHRHQGNPLRLVRQERI